MAILTNLFGESPFGALEAHGEKVHDAVRLLRDLFAALQAGDQATVRALAEQISTRETEADVIRNHLHEMLTSRVVLPVKNAELYNILENQDSMADRAEDLAFTLTFRDMSLPQPLMMDVLGYVEKILQNCELASAIMSRLDLLVESSFTGLEASSVSKLITELAQSEDAVKPRQIGLIRTLLAAEQQISPVKALLWLKAILLLADLSKCADRVGNGIRMTLQ